MKFVTQDYYQILNVSPGASGEEVKRAYRTVRQSFRPDSMAVHSLYSQEETETISAKIDEAFQILSQPELAGTYSRYHRKGRADMAIPRSPEVFFDEVHELDAASPIEALATAVSRFEPRQDEPELDEDFASDDEDSLPIAQPEEVSELLLTSLEEIDEVEAPGDSPRSSQPRGRSTWTPAPMSQRSSHPSLPAVSPPSPTRAASSSPASLKVTSPSIRAVSGPSTRGISQQASAARKLSPSAEATPSPRTGIACRTVISRHYDALPGEELEAIEVDCQGINGAYLRKVREALDLDLFYIAAHTKIGRAMLGYIEEDCVDELPARVYLKGYLCHIARLLKLPEAHTATHYLQGLEAR